MTKQTGYILLRGSGVADLSKLVSKVLREGNWELHGPTMLEQVADSKYYYYVQALVQREDTT